MMQRNSQRILRIDEATAALAGAVPPIRRSPAYLFALLIAAIVMCLLPLIYLGLIGAVGYGTYHYATDWGLTLFDRRASFGRFAAFIGPIIIGLIAIVFMLKPILARPARTHSGLALQREQQPVLFEFVDRLCEILRAPQPREIKVDCDVNASASFRHGWWSLFSNDLRLTIGLPLLAGLSLRAFAGVLAHELGHFTQGFAMRLTYVIGSVSNWLARLVYERDSWDEWLESTSEHESDWYGSGWISVVLMLARLAVWLSRRILWVLMMVGLLVSGFLSRRMEFDADRYEARVAGSDSFASTVRDLHALNWAAGQSYGEISESMQLGRLPDNLPAYIANRVHLTDEQLRKMIDHDISTRRTKWFDSHPADQDRIDNALREECEGIVASDAPASALLHNFESVCKTLTFVFYKDNIGAGVEKARLIPTAKLTARADADRAERQAAARLGLALLPERKPFVVEPFELFRPADPARSIATLREMRDRLEAATQRLKDTSSAYDAADQAWIKTETAAVLNRLGAAFHPDAYGVTQNTPAAIEQSRASARSALDAAGGKVDKFETFLKARLKTALSLLLSPRVGAELSGAAERLEEVRRLSASLQSLQSATSGLSELRIAMSIVSELYQMNLESLDRVRTSTALNTRFDAIHLHLQNVRDTLQRAPNPLAEANAPALGLHLIEVLPGRQDGATLFHTAVDYLQRLRALRGRLLSRLFAIAAEVENFVLPASATDDAASDGPAVS